MTSASPVVLLHGVGLDRTMWDAAARELTAVTVALDLPGHGERPPLRSPQTLASLAADVIDRLPDGPVHLVGFSLGALIAQHIARYAADRVVTLTCVSAVCHRTEDERAAVAARLRSAEADFAASVEASIARWYPAGTHVSAAVVEQTRRTLLGNDHESYLHAYAVFAHGDAEIWPELGRIGTPTLAITGEFDPGSTPDMTRRLAAALPDARTRIVAGARHMLPVEDAAALCASLDAFLSEFEGATL